MTFKTLLTGLLAFVLLSACRFNSNNRINGNGNVVTESRQVQNFTKIKVVGSMDVTVTDDPTAVEIRTDENIQPYITTTVENGWLIIKSKNNTSIKSSNGIKMVVSTPNLSAVKVTGSGNVKVQDKFNNDNDMRFELTGSGNVTAKVHTPSVKAEITGSGNLDLEGETRNVQVEIAGSGNFNAFDLKAESADVDIAGSGNAHIFAESQLNVNIAGSGDVIYKGDALRKTKILGSGKVRKSTE